MNRLFIELYLDEDVDVLIADLVQARGFRVETTHAQGRKGSTDAEQLAFAAERGWGLVTHNRVDFEVLAADAFTRSQTHAGLIIAARRPPYDIARRLLAILNQVSADEIENQIRYI